MARKIKKIAVVLSGWHFCLQPYEALKRQQVPEGWEIDYFCISHRDPSIAKEEKKLDTFRDDVRGNLDRILYKEMATVEHLRAIGWNYKEYPNTVGDWGNTNQWLEEHDYRDYAMILASHDDNLILNDRVFADIIESPFKWDIITNSPGMPPGYIRGSFEIFKPKVLKLLGGKFDLSKVTLDRTGHTKASTDIQELYDWNNMTPVMAEFIRKHKLKVVSLSPTYRVSAYCIEGERGYVSSTHGMNTAQEDQGLAFLKHHNLI